MRTNDMTRRSDGTSRPRLAPVVAAGVLPVYLLVVALCTVVFALDPTGVHGATAYTGICLAASAGVLWGTARHQPAARLPWLVLAAAPFLGAMGMVSRLLLVGSEGLTALVPDLLTIPAYLVFAAGLLLLLSARRGASAGSAVDGGLMAVAALLLSWALLIRPLLADADIPVPLKVLNGIYPTLSVLILFIAALLTMTEATKVPAFWLLAPGVVALLGGDLVYAEAAADGMPTIPLAAANVAYCAFYGLLGAAGLSRSMVVLSSPVTVQIRGYGHGRFVAVAVALLVPGVIVAVGPLGGAVERGISAVLLGVLAVLVLTRTATAVNRHAMSEHRLTEQARTDALTGLPNRLHLANHLEAALTRCRRQETGLAVLFMDLSKFKTVNDTWGHQTGDALLTQVGTRLAAQVRGGELVARVGGDEFVVVAEDVADAGEAGALAARLLAVFHERVDLGVTTVAVSTSIGIALATPDRPEVTAEDLLRDADTAMYRAKATAGHGGTYLVFDESMRVELAERLSLEEDLREALPRGEISLRYQPIVDLCTGTTRGFEALMRWSHPERGMVPPDVFIPVAEDTGLVADLGRWAIREAASQLREWACTFGAPLSMSVNLSPRQMHDPELVPTVAEVLAGLGLPPSSLALEITETTLIGDATSTANTIFALKDLGVRLSADDFGTGYSSLAYLRRFPFDQVKVDRSFVAGIEAGGDDEVIVAAVLSMARALSLSTVAEGVETPAQRDRLRALGADSGQGYLFARPLTAEEATRHLAAEHGALAAA